MFVDHTNFHDIRILLAFFLW